MAIQVNYYDEIIYITSPTTAVTVQELIDAIRAKEDTPDGMSFGWTVATVEDGIADAGGKADLGGGVSTGIVMTLGSTWQIQFWGGSGYTEISGGTIVGGVGDKPMKATGTAGDITVLKTPTDATIAETGVSGLTSEESDQLSNALTTSQFLALK